MNYKKIGEVHHITTAGAPIPRVVYNRVVAMVEGSTDYTYLLQEGPEYEQFVKSARAIIAGAGVTVEQVAVLRSSATKGKIIRRFYAVGKLTHRAAADYAAGASILTLSQTYDYPPMLLLRAILMFRGVGGVIGVFKGDVPAANVLSGRDLDQYELARARDIMSSLNEGETARLAQEAEDKFVAVVRALGIPLRDQAELVAEQTAKYGRAVVTPDILFTAPVMINGVRVHWIDFKNYVGSDIAFLRRSNLRQAERYTREYGTGAIAYGCGVVEGFTLPPAIVLDVRGVFAEPTALWAPPPI
jgi:hypothetical protein